MRERAAISACASPSMRTRMDNNHADTREASHANILPGGDQRRGGWWVQRFGRVLWQLVLALSNRRMRASGAWLVTAVLARVCFRRAILNGCAQRAPACAPPMAAPCGLHFEFVSKACRPKQAQRPGTCAGLSVTWGSWRTVGAGAAACGGSVLLARTSCLIYQDITPRLYTP
eukprot:5115584-Prymnesium_polylepis.1